MAEIFFTADTHFFHKRILEFCPNTRSGKDAEEMTELLIHNWNNQVSDKDTVYMLGDVSWGTSQQTDGVLERLKGNKYLVLGNHDRGISKSGMAKRHFLHAAEYMEHKIDGVDVIMFHFPVLEWNKMHYGSFHLYGHVHGKDMMIPGRAMDVGIDARPLGDMKLFTWEEVKTAMMARPIMDHH